MVRLQLLLPLVFVAAIVAVAQSLDKLELHKVRADKADFKGRQGTIHVTQAPGVTNEEDTLAILKTAPFQNGTIEVDVAGSPLPGANAGARGFIGIAFRVQDQNASKFELFYLRPTNGRADDQLRRNHSTQYVSFPDWPWHKTREATPGLYESYVDLQPAEWTKVKIIVNGSKANLYVNGGDQPCLIVNDLKHGPSAKGALGLWVGPGTDGYFANLQVKP